VRTFFGLTLALAMLAGARPSFGLTLMSPDVRDGGTLATVFTLDAYGCTGKNRPPRLAWSHVPAGTKAFALAMVDPDAPKPGGFVHWLVVGIPPSARRLGGPPAPPASVDRNDFGKLSYSGPCPPAGDPPHHYHITLTALDANVAARSYADFLQQRRGHVLATAHITVRFGR
jgi:Raf kinase inhibitor-like YbhB/YbcL family protein